MSMLLQVTLVLVGVALVAGLAWAMEHVEDAIHQTIDYSDRFTEKTAEAPE
ncbi:hypothetical protein CcrJ4_gp478 [Caulobacter phage J4]|nr:hypothetical protein CcrJ4_gp478 [Caulobacter phage J4]